ncbi:MAG: S1C family serine protease [Actinomycetota bacterium]|nr:S1C family serine protease [Actinomycetota bacterium]
MDPFGLGDEERRSPLLPPEDRLWRHPSEVAAHGMPLTTARVAAVEPRVWQVGLLAGFISAVLTAGLITVSSGLRDTSVTDRAVPAIERVVPVQQRGDLTPPASASSPIIGIAERTRPAIVQIKVRGGKGPGTGSGVVFRSDGHVLTNHHVVDGADRITAVMAGGGEEPARLVGSDPETDIAVVKLDQTGLPSATLGSATSLKVGQMAMAIGSPLGLAGGPSVSVGVISALGRQLGGATGQPLLDMIQTDAPVAPGSSGGALVDEAGAVIGITTAIAVTDVGAEGLGFATPIDIARHVAAQLISTGKVVHVWLGIEGEDVDAATAKDLGVDGGALVRAVVTASPAEAAGIARGDVITAVNGAPVRSMGALKVFLRGHGPGDEVSLVVVRDGARRPVKARLTERPDRP